MPCTNKRSADSFCGNVINTYSSDNCLVVFFNLLHFLQIPKKSRSTRLSECRVRSSVTVDYYWRCRCAKFCFSVDRNPSVVRLFSPVLFFSRELSLHMFQVGTRDIVGFFPSECITIFFCKIPEISIASEKNSSWFEFEYLNIYFSVIARLFFIIHFAMRIRTPLEKNLFNDLNFLILQSKSWRSRIPEVVNTIRLSRYSNMSVLYLHAWITPRLQSETFIS